MWVAHDVKFHHSEQWHDFPHSREVAPIPYFRQAASFIDILFVSYKFIDWAQ